MRWKTDGGKGEIEGGEEGGEGGADGEDPALNLRARLAWRPGPAGVSGHPAPRWVETLKEDPNGHFVELIFLADI